MSTLLSELTAAATTVAETAAPATVSIGRDHRGTGVVLADGLVVTSAHNLRDRTTQVTFAGGRTAQATVRGADVDADVAVLAVDTGGVAPLAWSDEPAGLGQAVFAVGRDGQGARVTTGFVSAVERTVRGPRGRRIDGTVEHTAPLARGSSGGPLLAADGRLLGLNTRRMGDGFYVAVPAGAALRERVDALAAGTAPSPRRLGVAVAPAHVARRLRRSVGLPERDGLLVRGVDDGSPAAAAGLRAGDLIVRAGATDVRDADDLWSVLDAAGDTLELGVVRGAEELTVAVTFAAPAAEAGAAADGSPATDV